MRFFEPRMNCWRELLLLLLMTAVLMADVLFFDSFNSDSGTARPRVEMGTKR